MLPSMIPYLVKFLLQNIMMHAYSFELVSINSFKVLIVPYFNHARHLQGVIIKHDNLFSYFFLFIFLLLAIFNSKYNQSKCTNTRAWHLFCQSKVSMVFSESRILAFSSTNPKFLHISLRNINPTVFMSCPRFLQIPPSLGFTKS